MRSYTRFVVLEQEPHSRRSIERTPNAALLAEPDGELVGQVRRLVEQEG